jgi:hypothetical protein
MIKYLFSIFLFLVTSTFFSSFGQDTTFLSTEERLEKQRFQFTTEIQEAVFFIGYGYTGGPGSMPVLDISNWNGRPLRYTDNLPIYMNWNFREQFVSKMPGCRIGAPQIIVSATIRLVQKIGSNSTSPPQKQAYYEVEIIALKSIEVAVKPCEK